MRLRDILIIVLCVLFTGFVVHNVLWVHRMAKLSSETRLRSTAYFIGITLAQSLNRWGPSRELLQDVTRSQPWEETAARRESDTDIPPWEILFAGMPELYD